MSSRLRQTEERAAVWGMVVLGIICIAVAALAVALHWMERAGLKGDQPSINYADSGQPLRRANPRAMDLYGVGMLRIYRWAAKWLAPPFAGVGIVLVVTGLLR